MLNNTLKELAKNFRDIATTLDILATEVSDPHWTVTSIAEEASVGTPKAEKPKKKTPAKKKPSKKEPPNKYTMLEIRKQFMNVKEKHGLPVAKDLIHSLGVKRLPDLTPEEYDHAMQVATEKLNEPAR